MKVGVARVVEDGEEAEETGMALGMLLLEAGVEVVEGVEVDEEAAAVDWEVEMVLDGEGDEIKKEVELDEETAAVDTELELLLATAADDELVSAVTTDADVALVPVENPPNVVCRIVVCSIVVVTGCRHTAEMPLPARNFPINSVCGAEMPAHADCRNAVSVCKPSMQASEQPCVGWKSVGKQLFSSAL